MPLRASNASSSSLKKIVLLGNKDVLEREVSEFCYQNICKKSYKFSCFLKPHGPEFIIEFAIINIMIVNIIFIINIIISSIIILLLPLPLLLLSSLLYYSFHHY